MAQKKSAVLSFAIHAIVVALVLLLSSIQASRPETRRDPAHPTIRLLYLPGQRQPAGGGSRSPLPPSQGIPARRIAKIFVAPVLAVRVEDPKLVVEPTLDAPPDVKLPDVAQWGDPLAKSGPPSGGPGGPIGAGGTGCCGVGPRGGPGFGSPGASAGPSRGKITRPRILYMVEPEYSEEARKSRHQGTVILSIVVEPSGRASIVKVLQGLGLGLDERAIEAVGRWRFEPARQDGKPVAASATVEVNFHLL